MFVKYLFILFITHCSLIIADAQWVPLSSGTNVQLIEVYFADPNTGTVVGISGKIIRTTNAGVNWINQPNSTGVNLWSVHLINQSTGIVTGDGGIIARTTNSGTNWINVTAPVSQNFRGVFFINSSTGFICGNLGYIIKTTNGGANWDTVTARGTNQWLMDINFPSSDTGYSCALNGVIIKSTDGGNTWSTLSSPVTNGLFGIQFLDNQTGYTCGDNGKILKTTNGGENWIQQNSPNTNRLNDLFFVNANTGSMVGLSNTIIRTTNGGNVWIAQNSGLTGQDWYGIYFTNTTTGFAVGSNGNILYTTTGGFSLPPAPDLTAPPNGAQNIPLNPLLDWDSVTTADYYNIQVATDSSFTTGIVLDTNNIFTAKLNVPSGVLTNNTLYYWRVRGYNVVGYGSWSATWHFTTIVALPNAPTLLIPVNGANNVSLNPYFDWDSTSPATYYRLQVSSDTSFANPEGDVNGITVSYLTLTTVTLTNNTRYYWRVNATNIAGTGPWSAVFNFSTIITIPPAPLLISPPNGANNVSLVPILDWREDVSAIKYHLMVARDSLFSLTVIDTDTITQDLYRVPPGILAVFTRYYWKVRTTNSLGTGPFSVTWNFRTQLSAPPPPVLRSPLNGAVNVPLTPLCDWDSLELAETYRIQISLDTTFSTTVLNIGGIQNAQYQVPGGSLQADKWYYWRVNGTNSVGTGPWSQTWNFKTVIAAPIAAPTLLLPPNGATNQPGTPLLDWTDVYNVENYQVQAATDSNFITGSIAYDSLVIPSQVIVPSGKLSGNTTYYWHVRGRNIGGNGPWSVIWRFTTGIIGINQISSNIPKEYKLYQNFPNPFNPITRIWFDIPLINPIQGGVTGATGGLVQFDFYDITGSLLESVSFTSLNPGTYEYRWNGSKYASGVYFYQLSVMSYQSSVMYRNTKRMVIIK